ncbi:MAG: metal-sensing transcriptional repressor [Pseudomonadota bacterium]
MTKYPSHATRPAVAKRLKRANGHLASVTKMIGYEQPRVDIAQQLYAVENAVPQAKRTPIQDHIDHCLDAALVGAGETPASAEFKAITTFL